MNIYDVANQMKIERKTIFDLNIKVTFYARVSTTRDEQENSIENQITFFTNMILENPNWTYVDGYVDRIRGESADNRVEFMKMIDDGKAGKFDLVLTKEVSRFARNTIDSLTYTRELLRAGVGVFFQNDNICTIETDSELRLTIMSSIAADEVRKLSERVKWGHKRAIESGRVAGNSRIFGYDKDNCKLKINEYEAGMIRLIFELYSTGDYSTRKLEEVLYQKGYRSRNNTRIQHNTIGSILRNPKYKGYYCGNKVKIVDYRTKEQKFLPEEEWVMFKDETGDIVPAIVSEELWDKCNKIFKERSEAVKKKEHSLKSTSVFTGKIICAAHNKAFWRTSYSNSASKGDTVYQWVCSEKRRFGAKACVTTYILESELYDILSKTFKDISDNLQEYITTFIEIYKNTGSDKNLVKQIESLERQLYIETNKREKLLELYIDGVVNKQEFTKRNDNYSVLISNLEQEITELKKAREQDSDYYNSIKRIEKYFLTMYDTTAEMTKEQVDEMTNALVDKIFVTAINGNTMKLSIKLKTDQVVERTYQKPRFSPDCRSGIMSLKMCPEQQYKYTHKNRTKTGHISNIVFIVSTGI